MSDDAAQADVLTPDASPAAGVETAPVAQPLAPAPGDAAIDDGAGLAAWLDLSALENLIATGGPVTIILLAMSVVTLTVILAKLWQFARLGVGRSAALDQAVGLWRDGREEEAVLRLNGRGGPAARFASHAIGALVAGTAEARVREDTERVALGELAGLRSGLRVVEATVQTAPLLGLFGTVLGMIASFRALQGAGAQADPAVLAGGIWVALLTTAVGLAIAIPSALALTWFQGRIERERERIEDAATRVFTQRAAVAGSDAGDGAAAVAWRSGPHDSARQEAL
jgi:biopolymer transport protein ExbB